MNKMQLAVGMVAMGLMAGCASTASVKSTEQPVAARPGDTAKIKNVVLVHGGFVDGSGT
jgi:outer membrane murein-binding lipoprotein Lpp